VVTLGAYFTEFIDEDNRKTPSVSRVIFNSFNACLAGAISTTVKSTVGFYAMSDDFAAAVITDGCELVDRAFEAVKRVPRS
jgi:hypothetical protein